MRIPPRPGRAGGEESEARRLSRRPTHHCVAVRRWVGGVLLGGPTTGLLCTVWGGGGSNCGVQPSPRPRVAVRRQARLGGVLQFINGGPDEARIPLERDGRVKLRVANNLLWLESRVWGREALAGAPEAHALCPRLSPHC